MAEQTETQEMTDEQLDQQIEERIDGVEDQSSEEPEGEESSEEPETSEEDEAIESLEEESEQEEEPEGEESSEQEEPSEHYTFKSQADAEKSYKNLLELQKRQAAELGEIRKQLSEKQEQTPTSEEKSEFADLSNDDLAELIISDPTKAVEAMQEQIMRRMSEAKQIETEREKRAKMVSDSEKAIDDFFGQDAYKDMDDDTQEAFFGFIKEHHNTNRALTVEDLTKYHNWMNYDKNLKSAQENARGKAIDDITSNSPKLKTLSNAKGAKAKGVPDRTGMDREQVQKLAEGMTDEELEKEIQLMDSLEKS
jgi:hypothetical protein